VLAFEEDSYLAALLCGGLFPTSFTLTSSIADRVGAGKLLQFLALHGDMADCKTPRFTYKFTMVVF
jgi:hypothetical protein